MNTEEIAECPDCGGKLEITEAPSLWLSIPFTRYEIWRWEKLYYCLNCIQDHERLEYQQIYDQGAQEGYEAGLSSRKY